MRASLLALLLAAAASPALAADSSPWRDADEAALREGGGERVITPSRYRLLALDQQALRRLLDRAPLEAARAAEADLPVLELPLPDGGSLQVRFEESPIMEPGLAARHPGIRTYRGQGIDDPSATTRFGWTGAGFHAIVLRAGGTVYIDPYRRGDTAHYVSYWKRDYPREGEPFQCLTDDGEAAAAEVGAEPGGAALVGETLRTYRLALAANVEYSDFHSNANPPDKADVLNNGLIPTMNRVNGIYEREVAVRMVMVANEEAIIFVQEPDGYTNGNGGTMLGENQAILTAVIGSANYDIGHVFSTGGGGVAGVSVVCGASKARGVTGRGAPVGDPFDVDYVAHEMGHQFGGPHTFNGNEGSCNGNRSMGNAYEVGSGSTIMAYAGICGSQDLQPNSDDVFHVNSLERIVAFTTTGGGNSCAAQTPTGNLPPVVDAGLAYSIPSRTPFALTATGSDPDGHPLTFTWEEFDLGPAGDGRTDNGSSPILRPFKGTANPTRTFPRLQELVSGMPRYGEILPTTTRTMRFRVTARDNRAAGGGHAIDETTVAVQAAAGPFEVTSPNTALVWHVGTTQTVTWNVANTTAAPINTAAVDIRLSTDGGLTYPIVLATGTPNDGSHAVTVPNVQTNTARVRVEAVGNVFFDISNVNFTVALPPVQVAAPAALSVDPGGNGVLQRGETAVLAPSWRNTSAAGISNATGAVAQFGGPAGATYTITDAAAAYGTIAVGGTASCTASGNCYGVSIAAASRPQPHWDATIAETFSPGATAKTWTLHVGDSFTDVPGSSAFFRFVETLFHRGVTGGCGPGLYCPGAGTSRAQMAVFVLGAKEGPAYQPPACSPPNLFADVPETSPFCRWIEELANRQVVAGCGGGNYCPDAGVTRDQMAVFVLRTLDPALDPPACAPPNLFADVPESSPFCRWIEELANRQVVTGCGGGNYCPGAEVTREQMAVFLTATFALTLYGP